MNNSAIIIRPVITEKSLKDAVKSVFTFIVRKSASKYEIANAVKVMFNVKVLGVKTTIMKGKEKITGKKRQKVKEPDFKKARVILEKGQKIDLFEVGESK